MHSPDLAYDAKLAAITAAHLLAHAHPTANVVLYEDEFDVYNCVYIALYSGTYGAGRDRFVGDLDTCYIVTPSTARQGACFDREWTAVTTEA